MQDVGKGEFFVNVRPWLPERLKNVVIQDQYVVVLVSGGGTTMHRNRGKITWRGNGGEIPRKGHSQLSPCGVSAARPLWLSGS